MPVGDPGAGGEPEFAGAGIAAEALAGANVDDAGDIVGRARGDFGAKRSGPADGEDQVDGAAFLDGGKGARGGGSWPAPAQAAIHSSSSVALRPEVDAVARASAASRERAA